MGDPNGTGIVQPLPRESDMPVVVLITEKVKAEGAKGHYYKYVSKQGLTVWIGVSPETDKFGYNQ